MRQISDTPYSLVKQPVLYVVRHGATGDDDTYNSPKNPKLTEQGRKDAQEAADFFEGKSFGRILMSGYHRSVETASAIQGNVPRIKEDRLDSLDVGDVSNAKTAEEADRIVKHHVANPHKKFPGGENLKGFRDRVDSALEESIQHYFQTGKPDIAVAHHSVQHEVGRLFNGDDKSVLTKTGGVIAVYMTPKGLKAVPIFKAEKV